VYVSDTGNYTLLRISTTGHVTTVAGAAGQGHRGRVDGWGAAARFFSTGLAFKANRSLYMGGFFTILSVH
jgi:hypothetical protein